MSQQVLLTLLWAPVNPAMTENPPPASGKPSICLGSSWTDLGWTSFSRERKPKKIKYLQHWGGLACMGDGGRLIALAPVE